MRPSSGVAARSSIRPPPELTARFRSDDHLARQGGEARLSRMLRAAALLAVACRGEPAVGGLTPNPALGLRIPAPAGFSVRALADGVVVERANTRNHPELRLTRGAGGAAGGSARKLANGGELASTVEKRE